MSWGAASTEDWRREATQLSNSRGGTIGWSGLEADNGALVTITGGSISGPGVGCTIRAFGDPVETSTTFIYGGTITGKVCVFRGELNLIGATLDEVGIDLGGVFNFFNGFVAGGVGARSSGIVNMYGGSAGGLSAQSGSTVNLRGGALSGSVAAHNIGSVANIFGGTFRRIHTGVAADVFLYGGTLVTDHTGFPALFADEDAILTIFGSDFNFPLGDIVETSGILTGTLADGSPLDADFGRPSTGTITLVPEPSALTVIGPGIAMLSLLYRRRRHSVER